MIEFLCQNLYSCCFLASVSGLLILLNVVYLKAWAFCYCLHFDCLGNHIKGMVIFM